MTNRKKTTTAPGDSQLVICSLLCDTVPVKESTGDPSRKISWYARGLACPLCGGYCEDWQTCVLYRNANPARSHSPDDFTCIGDTRIRGKGGIWTPEMVEESIQKLLHIYPFMTHEEADMAHILNVASEVSAKAGGSAGSGHFSKFVRHCVADAKERARQKGGTHARPEYFETNSDNGDGAF